MFPIYIQNLTTISPTVSEITSLIKMDTNTRQTHRNGRQLFRPVGVMKRRENIKLAIRPMDLIM